MNFLLCILLPSSSCLCNNFNNICFAATLLHLVAHRCEPVPPPPPPLFDAGSFHFEFPRCPHPNHESFPPLHPLAPSCLWATSKCCLMQPFNSFALTHTVLAGLSTFRNSSFYFQLSILYLVFAISTLFALACVASDLLMQMCVAGRKVQLLVLDRNVYGFYLRRTDVTSMASFK